MGKEWRAPYSVSQANREAKVARWKAIGKFKKAQRREQQEADAAGTAPALPLPTALPEQLRRKSKQKSAADGATRSAEAAAWQSRQRVAAQEASEREEAERVRQEQNRQRAEAKRRRAEQTAKLNKRTKRGQPILSNQVERMLAKIQAP